MAPGPTCHLSCHQSQPLTGVSHSHFLEAYASPRPQACCQGCRVSGHGAHPSLPWAPHLSPLDKHRESSTSPHSLQGEPGAPQKASPLPPFLPPSLPLPHSLSSIQRPASSPAQRLEWPWGTPRKRQTMGQQGTVSAHEGTRARCFPEELHRKALPWPGPPPGCPVCWLPGGSGSRGGP